MAESIIRCSDGHLYTANWVRNVGLRSIKLGPRRFARCPVDNRWRLMEQVSPNELSADEIEEAKSHHGRML